MSKLLARAKVKLYNAQSDYYRLSIDDAFIDDCCFNLQQAIEFSLKYLVEINGENYIENHDVRAQLNKLKELNVELPFFDQIKKLASTINEWEVETRYNDDFVALKEDIDDVKKLAEDIVAYSDSLVKEVN